MTPAVLAAAVALTVAAPAAAAPTAPPASPRLRVSVVDLGPVAAVGPMNNRGQFLFTGTDGRSSDRVPDRRSGV